MNNERSSWTVSDFGLDADLNSPYSDRYDPDGYDPDNCDPDGYDPDGYDPDGYDNTSPYDAFLGLGNKKKRAEKKLARAEVKLSKGKTKAATRLTNKADHILSKIKTGQDKQAGAIQQLQDVNQGQQTIEQQLANAGENVSPLSVQPMSQIGSSMGSGGGGSMAETASNVGSDSAAPSTATNPDDPTGWLADEKELDNVTVIGHKKKDNSKMAIIIIGVVLLVIALIYFAPKFMKGLKK